MPHLLLLVKGAYEIRCFCSFGQRRDKNLRLWCWASIGKKKLIHNVNNIAFYAMPHNSANVLGGGLSSTSFVEEIHLVDQEAKANACWYLEAMRKSVDLAFHARVVVKGIAIKIVELRGIPF